jgi:hypothetical protein
LALGSSNIFSYPFSSARHTQAFVVHSCAALYKLLKGLDKRQTVKSAGKDFELQNEKNLLKMLTLLAEESLRDTLILH